MKDSTFYAVALGLALALGIWGAYFTNTATPYDAVVAANRHIYGSK